MLSNTGYYKNLERRAKIIRAIRSFFEKKEFIEIETPIISHAPLPERNIDAVACDDVYLATSPEPYMKRLIAEGFPRIFQITKCFRRGENGKRHNSEFTMLEWYRTDADYLELIDDARNLINNVCKAAGIENKFIYQGDEVNVSGEWDVITIDELWEKHVGSSLENIPDGFEYDSSIVETIEPNLTKNTPVAIIDFPSVFSPMCKSKPENPARAERVEIYIAGIELANGCTEQINREIQICSLKEEISARKTMGKDIYPWPDKFIDALDKMPECAGMALGIDRLAMLLCDADNIADVTAFIETDIL